MIVLELIMKMSNCDLYEVSMFSVFLIVQQVDILNSYILTHTVGGQRNPCSVGELQSYISTP